MKKLSEIEITEEMRRKVSGCTTAEELAALAQEYGIELTREESSEILKGNTPEELSDDDLDQVTGGEGGDNIGNQLPPEHRGSRIGKYADGYVGKKVYCVRDDDPKQFCWGTLIESYEKTNGIWITTRVHELRIDGWNHDWDRMPVCYLDGGAHVAPGQVLSEISSDYCTLFLYEN